LNVNRDAIRQQRLAPQQLGLPLPHLSRAPARALTVCAVEQRAPRETACSNLIDDCDSTVGLAAWYVEKFRSWTDNRCEPDDALTKDEMITDIMVYWLTGTAHSAMRFYSESREHPVHLAAGRRNTPPTGVANLPAEIPMPPREWWSARSPSFIGRNCPAAATSPPGRCPTRSPRTYGRSSDRSERSSRHGRDLEFTHVASVRHVTLSGMRCRDAPANTTGRAP